MHPPQTHPQDPTAPPDEYQQQVQASIQALVSGQRPRDPQMSGASTGRLLLEGVVESLRIWREFKEGEGRSSRGGGEMKRHGRSRSKGRRDGKERTRRRRKKGPQERCGSGNVREDGDRDRDQHRRRRRVSPSPAIESSRGTDQYLMSGALQTAEPEQVAEQILGPEGTPFGHLPARGKGVGLLAHARTVYRYVKAEQDAGHRGKGYLEKHVDALFGKEKGVDEEGEALIEKNGVERDGRRRRKKPRGRDEGRSGGKDGLVFVPVGERELPSERQDPPVSPSASHIERSVSQAAPSVQRLPESAPPSRRNSHDDNCAAAPALEHEGQSDQGSVRIQSPVPSACVPPSASNTPLVGEVAVRDAGRSRSTSCAPTIRVQSPTPPTQTNTVRPTTPPVRGIPSRVQTPERERWVTVPSVTRPVPSQRVASPLPISITPPAVATPRSATPLVTDVAVPVAPPGFPPPPPPPPSPLPRQLPFSPDRNTLLNSIQVGAKLKQVNEEDRKDESAARTDDSCIRHVTSQTPMYEETPHSHNVEALEYAQVVEGRERGQDEKQAARTKSPFIAPQPKLPTNFQEELAAKSAKMNSNRQRNNAASEPGAGEVSDVVKPRASNETWRTVCSDNEYSEPDQAFRQRLGNQLLAGDTHRQPSALTTPADAPAREQTPAPDVFVNLAADIASPGWQSGPS